MFKLLKVRTLTPKGLLLVLLLASTQILANVQTSAKVPLMNDFAQATNTTPIELIQTGKHKLRIRGLGGGVFMLNVLNEKGETVFQMEAQENTILDFGQMNSGNYYFRFSDGQNVIFRKATLL